VASLLSRELKKEFSCRRAESLWSFRFCAIRLAMPFVSLSDRLDAQNAQIVSDRVLLRHGWPDVVFALYDAEEIGPRIHMFSIRCSTFCEPRTKRPCRDFSVKAT
jgi:hypothetical protein